MGTRRIRDHLAVLALVATAGCGRIGYGPPGASDGGPDPGEVDGGVPPAPCDVSGTLTPGPDVAVTANPSAAEDPSMVWTGEEFGVAWQDARNGVAQIYFARLDPSGSMLGSDAPVTSAPGPSTDPRVAWSGEAFAVTWVDLRDGNEEIYLALFDRDGVKLGSDVRVTSSAGESGSPEIVWAGDRFGVAWRDTRDGNEEIYLATLDGNGVKRGADRRLTTDPTSSSSPSITWSGSQFAVAWRDDGDGSSDIYLALADADGNLMAANTRVTGGLGNARSPIPVWAGDRFAVIWQDDRAGNDDLYLAGFDTSGARLEQETVVIGTAAAATDPWATRTTDGVAVSWSDDRDGNQEIYFARVSSTGERVDDDTRLSNAPAASFDSSVTCSSTGYAVVWEDRRTGVAQIRFTTLTP